MTRITDFCFRTAIIWIAAFTVVFLLLPLVVVVGVSFTQAEYLSFPPSGLSLRWYAEFLGDASYLRATAVSCLLALCATAGALLLGVPAAVALSRGDFAGKRAMVALFLSPLILPSVVIGAALLQFASTLGFARSFSAMAIGHTVIVMPYVIRTTLASLTRFDTALEEAARDLGANGIDAFFLVTLPVIKPGVVAGALFAMIISWINVEVSIFQVTAALMTIPVKMFDQIQYSVGPVIAAVSAATIYLAVLIVLALDAVIGLDRMTRVD